jgi:HK97 family phage portal protein
MNIIQKAAMWMAEKAIGFPPWRTDNWPNGSIFGLGGTTDAGIDIDALKSMQSAAVYGCVSVLDRVLTSLPKQVFRETAKGKVKATDHWSYSLIHTSPNAAMSPIDFWSTQFLAFFLSGQSYALKQSIGDRIVSLWPLHPERVRNVIDDKGMVSYEFTKRDGTTVPLSASQVIHTRNFSIDGVNGLCPIAQSREVIGQDLAAQRYASAIYRNGGFLRGVIRSKQAYNKEKAERWRTTWENTYGGSGNSGKVGILWEDAVYDPITMKPVDVEYMAQRRYSAAEIACLFGVPLNLLAQSDKTATYASAEQFDLQFVKYTVAPICARFESAFNKALFGSDATLYMKFSLAGLLRGDMAAQASFMSSMAQNGFMTRNEGREFLDLPLSDQQGADELTVQSNLLDLNALQKLAAPPKQLPAPATTGGNQP